MEGIAIVHNILTKRIHTGRLLDWTPHIVNGWKSLRAGSRYFTTGPTAADAEIVPFPPSVDPEGILGSVDGQRFRHTVDNDVGYFKREQKRDAKFKYVISIGISG
jgi:hypothetical protein